MELLPTIGAYEIAPGMHSREGWCWDDRRHLSLTREEGLILEGQTRTLFQLIRAGVERVIAEDLFDQLEIPLSLVPACHRSWNAQLPAFLTRLDLVPSSSGVQLLNIDPSADGFLFGGPTQWRWRQSLNLPYSQYNEYYEYLTRFFRESTLAQQRMVIAAADDAARELGRYLSALGAECGRRVSVMTLEEILDRVLRENDEHLTCLFLGSWSAEEGRLGALLQSDRVTALGFPWQPILQSPEFLPLLRDLFPAERLLAPTEESLAPYLIHVWMFHDRDAVFGITTSAGHDNQRQFHPHVLIEEGP